MTSGSFHYEPNYSEQTKGMESPNHSPPPNYDEEMTRLEQEDIHLKRRIRLLRIGTRILDFGCS